MFAQLSRYFILSVVEGYCSTPRCMSFVSFRNGFFKMFAQLSRYFILSVVEGYCSTPRCMSFVSFRNGFFKMFAQLSRYFILSAVEGYCSTPRCEPQIYDGFLVISKECPKNIFKSIPSKNHIIALWMQSMIFFPPCCPIPNGPC